MCRSIEARPKARNSRGVRLRGDPGSVHEAWFGGTILGMNELRSQSDLSDVDLMSRIAEGDADALAVIFDRYAPAVYAHALRVSNDRQIAADILYHVFLRVWRNGGRYPSDGPKLATWFLTIAQQLAKDDVRRRHDLREEGMALEETTAETAETDQDIRDDLEQAKLHATIAEALARLSPAERDVLEVAHKAEGDLHRLRSQTETTVRLAESKQASVADMAQYVQDVLGPRLAALVVGVEDAGDVIKWIHGEERPSPEVARHLRDAFHVAQLLVQAESPRAVRSWFLGMNPELDDRAPALVLADEPELVAEAAQIFLATG